MERANNDRASEWLQMESAAAGERWWNDVTCKMVGPNKERAGDEAPTEWLATQDTASVARIICILFRGVTFVLDWNSLIATFAIAAKTPHRITQDTRARTHSTKRCAEMLTASLVAFAFSLCFLQSNQPRHPSSHSTRDAAGCFLFNFFFYFVLFVSFS